MATFRRRAQLMGNLTFPVLSQPYIRGQRRVDLATNTYPVLVLPASLEMEIDGNPHTVPLTSTNIATIVADINAIIAADGEARNEGGYLAIYSYGLGEGAVVSITGGSAREPLGFPPEVDIYSQVEGGDIAFSNPDPAQFSHPYGPTFIQSTEDLTSEVVNRGLYQLAVNTDDLYHSVHRLLALPQIVEVDPTDAAWAARLELDGSGDYSQINLSDLSPWPELSDRVFIGDDLHRLSTLQEIAGFFAVQDYRDVEIIHGGEVVRVAGVTHGRRTMPLAFPDEYSAPTQAVPDTANWQANAGAGDGGNVLGGGMTKVAAQNISEIYYHSAVRVPLSTFVTDQAQVGDHAEIAGAAVNIPFNHNGTYRISDLGETYLFLQPVNDGDNFALNPDDSAALGSVTVTVGEFAEGCWLSFLPSIPAGTQFKLVFGVQSSLADIDMDYLLRILITTSEEVDDLVQKVIREMKGPLVDSTDDFTEYPFAHSIPGGATYAGEPDVSQELQWRRTTLQGAYDGQGRGSGGGFYAKVDSRPPRWENHTPVTAVGTIDATGTGAEILADNILHIDGWAFTLDDVGKTVVLRHSAALPVRTKAAFKIIDYLDSENVELEPATHAPTIPASAGYDFDIYEGRFDDFRAGHHVHSLVPSASGGRMGYVYSSDTHPGGVRLGEGYLSLREAVVHQDTGEELGLISAVFPGGSNVMLVNVAGFNPLTSRNIRAQFVPETGAFQPGGFVFISSSPGNDGWYRIMEKYGPAGATPNGILLADIDGAPATFIADNTGDAYAHFYYATLASGTFSPQTSGHAEMFPQGTLIYEDLLETASFGAGEGALGIDWRGMAFGGIWGMINDPEFAALADGDGASGPAQRFHTYNPAMGADFYHEGAPLPGYTANHVARSGFAGNYTALTRGRDMNAASRGFQGWALAAMQQGWDPSLLVLSVDDNALAWNSGWSDYTTMDSWAALVGANENAMSQLQNGFAEFAGAMRQQDLLPATGPIYGGVYSDLSGAFQRALYPLSVENSGRRYYQLDFGGSADKMARLGWRGQILPSDDTVGGTLPLVSTEAPNPAVSRSRVSSGFVTWDGGAIEFLSRPFEMYIGCQVNLSGLGTAGGTDGLYTIINVLPTDPGNQASQKVEVSGPADLIPTVGVGELQLLGNRWHYGAVDFTQFTLFGTHSHLLDEDGEYDSWRSPAQYPALGAWGWPSDTFNGRGDAYMDSLVWDTFGFAEHPVRCFGGALVDQHYGVGTGVINRATTSASYFGEAPFVNNGWHGAYSTSVVPELHPINPGGLGPFVDEFLNNAAGQDDQMNFWNSEWVWEQLLALPAANPPSVVRAASAITPLAGTWGMLLIVGDPNVWTMPEGTVCLWSKAQNQIRYQHFDVTVGFEVSCTATFGGAPPDVAFAVDLMGGANFATELAPTQMMTVPVDGLAYDLEVTFSEEDLREGAIRAYEDGGPWRIRVTPGLMFGVPASGNPAPDLSFSFRRIVILHDRTTNVHHGNLIVEGSTLSQGGFHALSPIRDYRTVHPAAADLYVPTGYATEVPIINDDNYGGRPFPVDPPGSAVVWIDNVVDEDEHFYHVPAEGMVKFNKGVDYSALRYLSVWTDPKMHSDEAAVGLTFRTHGFSPCARIGFSVPIDPPHGALLTELDVAMSFQAMYHGEGNRWNIWHHRDPFRGGDDDAPGVRIRLVRFHMFQDRADAYSRVEDGAPFNQFFEPGLNNGVNNPVISMAEDPWDYTAGIPWQGHQNRAFFEEILVGYMTLPDAPHVLNSANDNTVGYHDPLTSNKLAIEIGQETFFKRRYYTLTQKGGGEEPYAHVLADPERYVIDRRQYAYAVIIDAWGKGEIDYVLPNNPDALDGAGTMAMGLYTGMWGQGGDDGGGFKLAGLPPWAPAFRSKQTGSAGWEAHNWYKLMTPMMKFRGLRYGYEWTRVSPG